MHAGIEGALDGQEEVAGLTADGLEPAYCTPRSLSLARLAAFAEKACMREFAVCFNRRAVREGASNVRASSFEAEQRQHRTQHPDIAMQSAAALGGAARLPQAGGGKSRAARPALPRL